MQLRKFLNKTNVSISKFAEACDINVNTMFTYVHGKSEPTVSNAIKIIVATHGAVKLEDLKIKGQRK